MFGALLGAAGSSGRSSEPDRDPGSGSQEPASPEILAVHGHVGGNAGGKSVAVIVASGKSPSDHSTNAPSSVGSGNRGSGGNQMNSPGATGMNGGPDNCGNGGASTSATSSGGAGAFPASGSLSTSSFAVSSFFAKYGSVSTKSSYATLGEVGVLHRLGGRTGLTCMGLTFFPGFGYDTDLVETIVEKLRVKTGIPIGEGGGGMMMGSGGMQMHHGNREHQSQYIQSEKADLALENQRIMMIRLAGLEGKLERAFQGYEGTWR